MPRSANKALWDFLIDTSLAQSTQTPKSRELLQEIKTYVSDIYAPHDCSNLSKEYPLPVPPKIQDLGGGRGAASHS